MIVRHNCEHCANAISLIGTKLAMPTANRPPLAVEAGSSFGERRTVAIFLRLNIERYTQDFWEHDQKMLRDAKNSLSKASLDC